MSATLSLSQLTDLALGTPELGAVNFNVLHTLLHAIIQKVGISDYKTNINEADKDFLVRKKDEPDTLSKATDDDKDSAITGLTDDSLLKDRPVTSHKAPYHHLEDKVAQLEKKFESLNELPTNTELFQKSKGDSDNVRPVNDMWQNIQLKNRVDANESGVEKLMSLVQDMMSEITQLKKSNEELKKQLKDAKDIEELMKRLKELEDMTNSLNEQFSLLPGPDAFNDYVTWASLEDALKGLRENLEELKKPPVVIEMSSQTVSTTSRPVSARPITPSRRPSTPGPSEALQGLLEKLGRLTDRHDVLEDRVDKIEDELKNKADKDALEGIGVPEDLLQQLKDLQNQMEQLKKVAGKLESLEDMIRTLHTSVSNLSSEEPPPPMQIVERIEIEKTDSPDYSEDIGRLSKKLDDLNSDFESMKNNLYSEIEKLKEELVTLDRKLESYNNDILEQLEDVKTLAMTTVQPVSFERLEVENEKDNSLVKSDSQPNNVGLSKAASEINHLGGKVKFLTQNMNRQLGEMKKKMTSLESFLEKLQGQINNLLNAGHKGLSPQLEAPTTDIVVEEKDQIENFLNLNGNVPGESVDDFTEQNSSDSDALSRMQQAVLNLQAEVERLDKCTQMLIDENSRKQKDIENLFETCKDLQETKADKEFVQNEVDVKADKRVVDSKVNRSLFDTTCDELNKLISDILSKLSGHDEEWKKALAQLNDDLDGKLDRLEFGPIKDELDRQLRALLKKLKGMHFPQYAENDDDAAGIRKQLIQRFHCISCDRPVDMQPQGPIPSIPAPSGLPASKSTRPYTTFELEQIRQHAKSNDWVKGRNITNFERALMERQMARLKMHDAHAFLVHFGQDVSGIKHSKQCSLVQQPQVEVMDLYATQRACGGSHTMTYPHKRMTRMNHINNLFREDDPMPSYRNELEIQGADGHVYKGRTDTGRLPNLQSAPGTTMTGRLSPSMPRRAHTSMEPYMNKDVMPPSPRPGSARISRPSSGRPPVSRPMSAQARAMMAAQQTTEVPTAQMTEGSNSPIPPAPGPSEPEDASPPPARSPSPVTQPDDGTED